MGKHTHLTHLKVYHVAYITNNMIDTSERGRLIYQSYSVGC